MVRTTVPSTERRISSRGNPTMNVTSVRTVVRMTSISRRRGVIVRTEAVCEFKAARLGSAHVRTSTGDIG